MLPLTYTGLSYALVKDEIGFLKENRKDMISLRELYQAIKLLFNLPAHKVEIYVSEGQRIYRFDVLDTKPSKSNIVGRLYYLPEQRRLDIFDMSSSGGDLTPLVQVVGKKVMFKSYSMFLDMVELEKLFKPLIGIL